MISKRSLSSHPSYTVLMEKFPKSFFYALFLLALLTLPDWANAQICPPATHTIINIPPNITVNESPLPGLLPPPGSATIVQRVVIRGGGSILFVNSYTFAPGSEIIFQDQDPVNILGKLEVASGVTLTLLGTTVRGCELYEGITVRGGGTLSMLSGSTIQDALAAVTLKDQASLTANQAIFQANYFGIYAAAPNPGGPRINVNLSLVDNGFFGQDPLLEILSNGEGYPHFGIFASDVVNINVDASAGVSNLFLGFKETNNPIGNFPVAIFTRDANLTVKNAQFRHNGQLNIGALPEKVGYAIYAVNPTLGSNLIVTGSSFEDEYKGIVFSNGNLTVNSNDFQKGLNFIHILPNLQPWKYDIIGNTFQEYAEYGVRAENVFPAKTFNLKNNKFLDNLNGLPAILAASFESTNTASTALVITNNQYYKSSTHAGDGFNFRMGQNSLVETNSFTSTNAYNALNLYGTKEARVYRNSITGVVGQGTGINATDAFRSAIICNSVDDLYYGMYFDGYSCDATTLAENTFGDHEEGLSLTENTTIGQQIHHRNAWPTTGSLLEANYALDPLDPALGAKLLASKFDIDLTETTSPNYWAIPRYPVGNAWFKYVPAHVITEKCPPFSDPGGGKGERRLSITDENVIAGMQPVYDGFDATLWDAQVRAYRNLYENPQLRLEGSEAEAFYTANTETSYAQLAVILSRYDQALTTDSVILEQLGNLYAQAQEAQEAQSENLAALNQEIALLHGSVTDTRNEQLNSLQNDLAVVQVSAEYEINLKSVLAAIITSALSDSPWNWTNEQQAILQPIAAQCKLPGGYGVVLARLMLNQYDLEENCITENRNAQITSIGAINWRVSPNPTGGNLQISLPVSTNARTLDLYDQWGKKIKSQKLGTESAFSWDLSGLINGIYCLKLTGGKELYSVQRIVVQH